MIYFTIVFLCTAGLFLFLLEDRFRVWATVGVTAAVYLLSLAAAFFLRRIIQGPVLSQQLPCIAGSLLFFLSSLFLYTNNILQKLFLALLSLCNFTFLGFFIPLLLGLFPFSVAGAFAGVFSVLVYVLFTLLTGLCLYRPIRHYSDRGPSGFLLGMCLILAGQYALCLGLFDFLFRGNVFAARLLAASLVYCAVIFGFRSLYQAGRFRERAALQAARQRILEMETGDFIDMLTAVREVRAAQKAGEYALDTVNVMLADGWADKVPEYLSIAKRNAAKNPILAQYHEEPLLNAVIATKAAFAAQNGIEFECNAGEGPLPLQTADACVVVNEILTRACQDASAYPGKRTMRFTISASDGAVNFEALYSAKLPEPEKFTWKGKKAADIARWLFDDSPAEEAELKGLENTQDMIGRYSGKLSISAAGQDEVILQVSLKL